jgi:hypothetical protein
MSTLLGWLRSRPFRRLTSAWRPPRALRRALERLEEREVPSAAILAVGADAGGPPRVSVFDRASGAVIRSFTAYNAGFTGGVRVATADFNGDGTADIVTAPGRGMAPEIKVFDGKTGTLIRDFLAFDSRFTAGVNVAVGDVNGDKVPDVIAGADAGGGPHVKVFDGKTGQLLRQFYAFGSTFAGGVRLAAADVNGDGVDDVIAAAGRGGGPHVKVFDGKTGQMLRQFFAFGSTFAGGVYVAAADLNADVVAGAGPGGGPAVSVFDGATGKRLSSFFAYEPTFTGGVRVGAYALDGTGRPAILTARGAGGGSDIRLFSAVGGKPAAVFAAFAPQFRGGAFVAGSGLPAIGQVSGGKLGNFFQNAAALLADPVLVTLQLNPLNINLLGLQVQTSPITVTVSAQPGSGELLGNLLTVAAGLVNLQGVNNALNNVLGNVVTLLNSASLAVNAGTTGPLSTAAVATTPVLDLFVAPVHLNLLGALVDTSPIHLTLTAHSGPGLVLGNVVTDLANLFNPPLPKKLTLDDLNARLQNLLNQLNAQLPGIPSAPFTPANPPAGTDRVVSLDLAPINLNLLGLNLKTSEIRVNADALTGNGLLLGNVLTTLLNTLGATPQNLTTLSNNLNAILAKVIGVLNASNLTLATGAVAGLTPVLQTLTSPTLVTPTAPATSPVLNLAIASTDGTTPPVDVNLLGLVVTTSNIQAQLNATTGDGQILGNLVYNVAHLLDPGGALNLLTILGQLGL